MRTMALIAATVALAALALALVVPALMDWSRFKAPLVARLEQATGRAVTLSGPVGLRLLPSPALTAEGLSIANPPGAAGEFAAVERLRVHVAPLPLLIGRVRVTELELDRPRLHLARLADGRPNWVFGTAAPAPEIETAVPGHGTRAEPPAAVPSEAEDALPVGAVVVGNGAVTYADEAGERLSVTDLVGRVRLGGRSGPFQAEGAAKLGGALVSFDGTMDRVLPGRASPVALTLRLPGDDARLSFQGLVTQLSGGDTLRGHLTVTAAEPRRSLSRLGVRPPMPAGDLALDAELSLSAQEMSATNLVASLGEARATGAVTAALGEVPQVDVRLNAAALDLDKWRSLPAEKAPAAAAPPPAPSPAAPPPAAAAGPAGAGFVPPDGLFATIALSVDALSWHGQVAREAKLDAVLDQGEVMLRSLSAQLPGNTALAAEGSWSGRTFDGKLFLRSDNLRTLLAWTGSDPAGIPEARLRNLDLSTPVRLSWPELSLPDFRLTLDSSHARGGLTLRLGGRPALGLAVSADSLNLDAYRPVSRNAGPVPSADAPQAQAPALAAQPTQDDGGFDADVTVKVQNLVTHGIALDNVEASALLQAGVLEARRLSAGLGGSRISAQGRVAGALAGAARLERVSFHLDSPEPARLFRALGGEGPKLPALRASGVVSGDAAGTVFDLAELSLTAGPSSVAGQGRLDLSGARPLLTAELAAKELALDGWLTERRSGMLLPGGPRLPPFAVPPGASAIPAAAGAVGFGGSPFTRDPIVLGGLSAFDARLGLTAETVTAKGWRLEQAAARLAVQDGTLVLDTLTGRLLGGALNASAKLASAPVPALSGALKIEGADLSAAPLALGGGFMVTQGRLDAETRFTTSGRSSQDMAAGLDGQGTLSVRDGVLDGFDLPAVNQRMGNVENWGSLLGVVQAGMAGGRTPFSVLSGTFHADKGVVVSRDLKLDAQGGGASAQSTVDLPRWTTSSAVSFHLANAAQAPLGLRLEGPLDNPRKIIDINALQQYLVTQGLGRALKGKGDEQQAEGQPREKNTGKNILKNLLKGLGGQ